MSGFDAPAIIEETSPEVAPKVPVKAPEITPEMKVSSAAGVDRGFAAIKGQPMVKIRVPKVHGPQTVTINGARFNIPSNIFVEVPEQVAQILADAERI